MSKTALVTGGSHGIGAAICLSLAEQGYNIFYFARGKRYPIGETAKLVESTTNVLCRCMEINVDTEARARYVIDQTMHHFGSVDVLVNNLGGGSSWGDVDNWEQTQEHTWVETIQHNYLTTVWFTNLVVSQMVKRKWGRVVAINGVYGKERGGMPWFHAAKSAQLALMKSYSGNPQYASNGITFNTICPGFTDVRNKDKQFGENLLDKIPARRFGVPEDIAPLVTFLCSDNASYINGACIMVDGGMSFSI